MMYNVSYNLLLNAIASSYLRIKNQAAKMKKRGARAAEMINRNSYKYWLLTVARFYALTVKVPPSD